MRVIDLANWIIKFSIYEHQEKSILKLHKITYFIIRDYFRKNNKMLVSDFDFVITRSKYIKSKSIDRRFWRFGANTITSYDTIHCIIPDAFFLVKRLKKYLKLKPWQLVKIQNNTIAYQHALGLKEEFQIEEWMLEKRTRI